MSDSISQKENIPVSKKEVKVDLLKTYLNLMENSLGISFFQNLYGEINGSKADLTEGGKRSCARFVSAILLISGLIEEMHATVSGTVRDMSKNGWYEIKKPRKGAVLVWGPGPESEGHGHIGFYIEKEEAISNSTKEKVPVRHHWTYGEADGAPKRPPISIWWNDKLGS